MDFRQRLQSKIDDSKFRSVRHLAKSAGINPATLHAWLQPKKGGTEHGPGVLSLASICPLLEVGIDELVGLEKDGKPSFNQLIRVWEKGGRNYSSLSPYQDYFDSFELPDANARTLKLVDLGKRSLASELTGIVARRFFQETMNMFGNSEKRATIIKAYSEMKRLEMQVSIEEIAVPRIGHLLKPVIVNYQTLRLLAKRPDACSVVINYSIEI